MGVAVRDGSLKGHEGRHSDDTAIETHFHLLI